MRNFSAKLTPPALALAMGAGACAPMPEPKQPEAIVVEIPFANASFQDSNTGDELIEHQYRVEPTHNKKRRPLTVEQIMKDTPSVSASVIDSEIEKYASYSPRSGKSGKQAIANCFVSDRVTECINVSWNEKKRSISENNPDLSECDHTASNNEEWVRCVNEKVDQDDQARAVRAYCSEMVLRCIQHELER